MRRCLTRQGRAQEVVALLADDDFQSLAAAPGAQAAVDAVHSDREAFKRCDLACLPLLELACRAWLRLAAVARHVLQNLRRVQRLLRTCSGASGASGCSRCCWPLLQLLRET